MTEEQARQIAKLMDADSWNTGGEIYLVIFRRTDGKIVALSDEVVCEYADEEALEAGKPTRSITLR